MWIMRSLPGGQQEGVWFVTRQKGNANYTVIEERTVPATPVHPEGSAHHPQRLLLEEALSSPLATYRGMG